MNEKTLLSQLKVLFVEDDEDIVEQMVLFMKKKVGQFFYALNGVDGFSKYIEFQPDLVITDLKMPLMDGLTLTKKIRELNKTCPIIITTAFSDVDMILDAVDCHIDKYLLKPINAMKLPEIMEEIYLTKLQSLPLDKNITEILFTDEEKQVFEKKLQSKFSFFLKTSTGKGPKATKVIFQGKIIEVLFKEPLTLFENSLLKNRSNGSMVIYNRQAFYRDYAGDLCNIIRNEIQLNVKITDYSINLNKNKEIIQFTIDNSNLS